MSMSMSVPVPVPVPVPLPDPVVDVDALVLALVPTPLPTPPATPPALPGSAAARTKLPTLCKISRCTSANGSLSTTISRVATPPIPRASTRSRPPSPPSIRKITSACALRADTTYPSLTSRSSRLFSKSRIFSARYARSAIPLRSIATEIAETARDAAAVVRAGAAEIHLHVRDEAARESLAPDAVDATLAAVRAAVPGTLVGVSTGAWIEGDEDRRLAHIAGWRELPDHASVNLSEPGAPAVVELLHRRVGLGADPSARRQGSVQIGEHRAHIAEERSRRGHGPRILVPGRAAVCARGACRRPRVVARTREPAPRRRQAAAVERQDDEHDDRQEQEGVDEGEMQAQPPRHRRRHVTLQRRASTFWPAT